MDVKVVGQFRLLSPLSHIGEAISTNTYLVQEPILQPDGSLEEVFCYSGNAWRGQLRDLCASYMLRNLGNARLPIDAFHLMFSGGKIGGDQKVDVGRIRTIREEIPMLALFGGGIGNQIMPGKLRVSNCYPICVEAAHLLPDDLLDQANQSSYRQMTMEKSFSRKDDTKDDRLLPYLAEMDLTLLEGSKKKDDAVNTQMRMTNELLVPGACLYTTIDVLDCTKIELGCLVSALHQFAISPHIGGQANRGHGRVALFYDLFDLASGEAKSLVKITEGPAKLSRIAEDAKQTYDVHLKSQYDAALQEHGGEMLTLLGAA